MNNNNINQKKFMGFETWYNNTRMAAKMQIYIFILLLIIQLLISLIVFFSYFSEAQVSLIITYLISFIVLDENRLTDVTIGSKTYQVSYLAIKTVGASLIQQYMFDYFKIVRWSFLLYFFIIPINYLFYKRNVNQTNSQYVKGAIILTPLQLHKRLSDERCYLPFGEVNMPVSAEVKHALIIGRPGVGKTVCMSQMLEKIIRRGDRAIIHDFKGDYLQKFYNPEKDIIFNPLDSRSHYWNFFYEIDSPIDVDAIGYALIPDAKGSGMDPFWNNAARDVFTGCVNYLVRNKKTTYADLYSLLTSPSDVIASALQSTVGSEAGATTIADPESKQTGSIMSVLTQYTKIFGYMKDSDDKSRRFVINEWLENHNAGNIYITNYSTLQNTLAPILTLMIDLMGRKLLSLKDNSDRRIFFMLDEFGALQKMQTITSLLTLARSKGGGVFLGIQDLGQLDKIYGKEHKQTIVNACGSSVVFAVADSETAESLSKKYGEYISIDSYVTQSMGVQSNRDGLSINQQKNKERIVMPSEIMGLADLNCYVQFPGMPVTKTHLTYKLFNDYNEPFIVRSGLSYNEILSINNTKEINESSEVQIQSKDDIFK